MLKVDKLSFSFDSNVVLNDVSFKVNQGENVAIIGESGCGKSTLLKLIYGEFDLDKGHVFWKDTEILGPKFNLVVGYDFVKCVTQEFDLMPFITVEENIGKFLSNFFPEAKQKRVTELLEVVGLERFAKTKVKYLSGGQKQRVALARAIAKQPELILLDEPFSNIDSFKKQNLRRKLFKYLKNNNITCVMATHDKDDVLGFSDRVLVIDNNKIIARGTPVNLYNNPTNNLIAAFFGEFNELKAHGLVYAHDLKVDNDGQLETQVQSSYFKGNCYLIAGLCKQDVVYFYHNQAIPEGNVVRLKIVKQAN